MARNVVALQRKDLLNTTNISNSKVVEFDQFTDYGFQIVLIRSRMSASTSICNMRILHCICSTRTGNFCDIHHHPHLKLSERNKGLSIYILNHPFGFAEDGSLLYRCG